MSTRQATPGSSRGVTSLAPSMSSRKRGTVEPDGETDRSRFNKKPKNDDGTTATKDKKKRRKRKRKLSITVAAGPVPRPRSMSRSTTVGTHSTAPVSNVATPDSLPVGAALETESLSKMDTAKDTAPRIPPAEKGKGKAKEESPPSETIESPNAQIARLQQELETQTLLLRKHQTHLSQVHQALTCQICLDLLHKPFALAPCGHVVCHGCLVRWFTANEKPGGRHPLEEPIPGAPPQEESHVHKKKKCPICRTLITERPVEVWGVKSMVTSLVRSELVELPAPPPEEATTPAPEGPSAAANAAAPDPWRNIFRRANNRPFFDLFAPAPPRPPRNAEGGLEDMGMYDMEDGGIYRCIDCMHEIWDGVCTHCHREYPGHRGSDDGDDDEEMDFDEGAGDGFGRRRTLRDLLDIMAGGRNAFAPEDSGSESEGEGLMFDGLVEEDEEEDDVDEVDGDLIPSADPFFHTGPLPVPVYHPNYGGPRLAHAPRVPLPVPRQLQPQPVLYANFTDDEEEEAGIARIEEAGQQGGEEDDGYESSFIDDGDTAETSAAGASSERGHRGRGRSARRTNHPAIVVSDDEEDSDEHGDDGVAVEDVARIVGRDFRLRRRGGGAAGAGLQPSIVVVDSEDEDQERRSSSPGIQILGRHNDPRVVVSSNNERSQRRRRLVLDEEDSEESNLEYIDLTSEESDQPQLSWAELQDDEDDERGYNDDGSRAGPSSRLLRLMEAESLQDADGEDDDDEDEW